MQIHFANGNAGFHEAAALCRIVRQAQDLDPRDSREVQLLDLLRHDCETHMAAPEFAALRSEFERNAAPASDLTSERSWWRRLFGPSNRELMLSAQRVEVIERAQHAEQTAFAALAENARLQRELDEARTQAATSSSNEDEV